MFGAWQECCGNYKPMAVFERGDCVVIVRNIKEEKNGVWEWEEYAMPKDVYQAILAGTETLEHQTEQNTADIDYIATMVDVEL